MANDELPADDLEWQHRQREISLGRKLPPSEELIRARERAQQQQAGDTGEDTNVEVQPHD
jgi:hypothetical protein